MAISMVREPSETPNINNVDDFVGLRYAYNGQNGYVQDFGNNCSNTINGSTFHINSGRLVLQGVECDINANGVDITVDNVSATRYYIIYLQVNLSNNQVSIQNTYSTGSYPTVSDGDDLTQNSSGTANLILYKFEATNGTISNVIKVVKAVSYPLGDYDITSGTVETRLEDIDERLTRLGFREGTIPLASGISATTNYIKRQGNYVFGKLVFSPFYLYGSDTIRIGNIPLGFAAAQEVSFGVIGTATGSGYGGGDIDFQGRITAGNAGSINIVYNGTNNQNFRMQIQIREIDFGYEAAPITT